MPTAWLLGCASGADPFIEKYFSDCVYSLRDYIGFCLGLAAILFWIVAQVPQWVRNYQTKSAEALSPWFLAQWLLGDTFNLLGCLLQGQQLPTTTYTAMYFVVADVFMMMQYIYYGALQRRKEKILQLQVQRRHHHRRHHQHGSGRSQQHTPGTSAHVVGYDGSTKEHGVYNRQQSHQQQQSRRQLHSAARQYDMVSPSDDAHSKQHAHKGQQQEPQLLHTAASHHLQQQCQPSTAWKDISEAAGGERLLPQSCAAAARLHSPPVHRQLLGGVHLGGYKSAVTVGVLVILGVVTLAMPANSTWGVLPAEGAAARVAAPQRAMQAGAGPDAEALHSIPVLTSGVSSLAAGAAGAGVLTSQSAAQLSNSQDTTHDLTGPERDVLFVVGTVLGYCSSVLYLCSRLSQIHKNYTRESSEGLALAMFMMAVCANLCTGTGIVMRTFTLQELKEQLPWIIGSLGTISLDMVILWQSIRYGDKVVAGGGAGTPAAAAAVHHHHHERQQVTPRVHQQQYPYLPQSQQQQQQQHQQRDAPGHTTLDLEAHRGAAAHYRCSTAALPPVTAISIPKAQHTSISVRLGFLSSSAPVIAGWGGLSHHRAQDSIAAADERRDSDAATPLLSAHN